MSINYNNGIYSQLTTNSYDNKRIWIASPYGKAWGIYGKDELIIEQYNNGQPGNLSAGSVNNTNNSRNYVWNIRPIVCIPNSNFDIETMSVI